MLRLGLLKLLKLIYPIKPPLLYNIYKVDTFIIKIAYIKKYYYT